ncbi:MAG: SDR family oxidoreductase [Anaerolineae bacterium]|nr:SDR family oxidoreductase [Anaerolineae bacterium]
MNALQGQTAIITGGSRGMGAAIARAFAAEGAKVGLIARTKADLDAVAQSIRATGGTAAVAVADVTQRDQVLAAVDHLRQALGPIDILVNNAGIGIFKLLTEMTEAEWDAQFDLNLKAIFLCSQAVVGDMMERKRGLILNVGSMAGLVPGYPRGFAYNGTKWALVGLNRCLAIELKPYNIRVTLINPGTTDTFFRPNQGQHPEWLQAEDVAAAALFVATARPEVSLHEIAFSVTRDGWA